ncbi:Heme-degrading monooxygenase [compost metagenome]
MVIVTNTSQLKKGYADQLIERFNKVGKVETMKGFLGLEVMLTDHKGDYDEVTIVTRWEARENFQEWTRSDAFRESHSHRQIPDYILDNKISFYDVKIVRHPLSEESASQSESEAG